jgi:hypothetical protein
MSDESDYGKRIIVDQDRAPVEKAAGQYAVSPTNPAFIKEYRAALQAFITKHRNDADPDLYPGLRARVEQARSGREIDSFRRFSALSVAL